MNKQELSKSGSNDALATQKKKVGWLKIIGGTLLLIVAFLLALKLASFLIKWGVLLLLLYGGYRLIRYLLSDTAGDNSETILKLEQDPDERVLNLLENERELEELKSRMESEWPR